jgi:hypothetical protein
MATLLASVVSTARRDGSKVRNTGADERASFSQSQRIETLLCCWGQRETRIPAARPSAVSGAATSE